MNNFKQSFEKLYTTILSLLPISFPIIIALAFVKPMNSVNNRPLIPTTICIAEMLVQSQMGKTELLPALPKAWKHGYVKGLVVRGGKEIELKW